MLGAAGGTGLAACELGKLLGLKVIACALSDEKLEFAKAHGAELGLNYNNEDLKEGLDALRTAKALILFSIRSAVPMPRRHCVDRMGRALLVIGFAAGDIPKMPLNLPSSKAAISAAYSVAHGRGSIRGSIAPTWKTRKLGRRRQDLLACRPHLPVSANRRRSESARWPQGDGQGDPASLTRVPIQLSN